MNPPSRAPRRGVRRRGGPRRRAPAPTRDPVAAPVLVSLLGLGTSTKSAARLGGCVKLTTPFDRHISPFWIVTHVFYNTCVTAVKCPFLPPWRSCVTVVEGGEQGIFCVTQKYGVGRRARHVLRCAYPPRRRCAWRRRSATLAPCPTAPSSRRPPHPATTAGGPLPRRPIATSTTSTRGRACSASAAGTPVTAPLGDA